MTVTTPGIGCCRGLVTVVTAGTDGSEEFVTVTTTGAGDSEAVVEVTSAESEGVLDNNEMGMVMVGVVDGHGEVMVMMWTECDDVAVGFHGTVTVLMT
jgi:hypothetical protein